MKILLYSNMIRKILNQVKKISKIINWKYLNFKGGARGKRNKQSLLSNRKQNWKGKMPKLWDKNKCIHNNNSYKQQIHGLKQRLSD